MASALIAAVLLLPPTASAAPPANDDFDSATVITSLPFTDSVDTTEATTAEDDPFCAGQGHTVWYSFTPAFGIPVEAHTAGSNYDTTLSVYTGSRGSLDFVDCDDDSGPGSTSRVLFTAQSGVTYYFMAGAFSDRLGGNLQLTVSEGPPPPPPPPVTLSPAGQNASDPQVGIDTDGDALAVWENNSNDRIQARARSAAGALGPVQVLSALSPEQPPGDPQVAVDADGDALVVWERTINDSKQVLGRPRAGATGALGPVQALSAPEHDALDPQIAIDAEGDALAVWEAKMGTVFRIQARARSAAGALGPVQVFSAAVRNALDPQVASDADGDSLAVWEHFDGANWRIEARARSATGVVGPVATLSDPGQNAFDPQVAVDSDGDALVVWRRFDGAHWRIEARARSAGGTLGPVEPLSDAGQNAYQPQVAIDADGDAIAVWRRHDGTSSGCCLLIQARARSAAGALGAAQTLSGGGHNSFDPQVGIDAAGNAVAVWRSFVSRSNRIELRRRSATGVLGPLQIVSSPSAFKPQVAVAADGATLAVWERFDGTNRRIQAVAP